MRGSQSLLLSDRLSDGIEKTHSPSLHNGVVSLLYRGIKRRTPWSAPSSRAPITLATYAKRGMRAAVQGPPNISAVMPAYQPTLSR